MGNNVDVSETVPEVVVTETKRGRGRPKGSKNKKGTKANPVVVEA
jgi:hypothetical protein